VLSSFDDFPIHQTSRPVAHTSTADLNHYDRYFFNGYTTDPAQGSSDGLFFALAMGLYPNRHVADAAFSVVVAGGTDDAEQINVRASRRAPTDRADANEVGPILVEVVEPLQVLELTVEAPEHGLRAQLRFTARSAPIEEPHFYHRVGVRVMMDYTRLTQFGRWDGWIEVDGKMHEVSGATTPGSRDRSWGVRPVGERGPSGAPVADPQFYWLWAPVCFDAFCTHFDVNELADGKRWHETGFIAGDGAPAEAVRDVDYHLEWRPGTRAAGRFALDLVPWNGDPSRIELEPLYEFQMTGLGYSHPEWGHGVWKGELEVAGDRWRLPVADPTAPHHVHVQAIVRARSSGGVGEHDGVGILEQYAIGRHIPTGLEGFFDGFEPTD